MTDVEQHGETRHFIQKSCEFYPARIDKRPFGLLVETPHKGEHICRNKLGHPGTLICLPETFSRYEKGKTLSQASAWGKWPKSVATFDSLKI